MPGNPFTSDDDLMAHSFGECARCDDRRRRRSHLRREGREEPDLSAILTDDLILVCMKCFVRREGFRIHSHDVQGGSYLTRRTDMARLASVCKNWRSLVHNELLPLLRNEHIRLVSDMAISLQSTLSALLLAISALSRF